MKTTIFAMLLMQSLCLTAQTLRQDAADTISAVWTLDRCIEYAMTHATDIRKKRVEADNARQDRGAAMGGFMPSVSASVGAQFSWGRNVDPETNTYVQQQLFRRGVAHALRRSTDVERIPQSSSKRKKKRQCTCHSTRRESH